MLNGLYVVSIGFALVLGILASVRYSELSGRETSLVKPAILSIIPIVNLIFIGLCLLVLFVSKDTFDEALEERDDF